MLFDFETRDKKFNANMDSWRIKAFANYGMSLLWIAVTPFIVSRVQPYVPSSSLDNWLVRYTIGSWGTTYLMVLVSVFFLVELIGWFLINEKSDQYPSYIDDVIHTLTAKARLEKAPRMIYIKGANKINAGAMRSFLFGNKVILFGDITKLKKEQLEAVLAHEMAHIIMADVIVSQLARGLLAAVRVLNLTTFLALILSAFAGDHDLVWFLLVTYLVTMVGSWIARLFYMKYSRICEYRADAIAVQLTTPEHRKHLVEALKQVTELSIAIALRKRELQEVDTGTHPTFRNRAKALGIKLFTTQLWRAAS